MACDPHIAFEIGGNCVMQLKNGEWNGHFLWDSSPITFEETGMSKPCAELLHKYLVEYGDDVYWGAQLKKAMKLDDFLARDGVRSFEHGAPEVKEEANSQMLSVLLAHYRRYGLCASGVRIITNTEKQN